MANDLNIKQRDRLLAPPADSGLNVLSWLNELAGGQIWVDLLTVFGLWQRSLKFKSKPKTLLIAIISLCRGDKFHQTKANKAFFWFLNNPGLQENETQREPFDLVVTAQVCCRACALLRVCPATCVEEKQKGKALCQDAAGIPWKSCGCGDTQWGQGVMLSGLQTRNRSKKKMDKPDLKTRPEKQKVTEDQSKQSGVKSVNQSTSQPVPPWNTKMWKNRADIKFVWVRAAERLSSYLPSRQNRN